jgi:hypothetical protein
MAAVVRTIATATARRTAMRRIRTPFTVMALTNPKSLLQKRSTSLGRSCRKKNGRSSVGGSIAHVLALT